MAELTSSLIVRLVDRVSAPARDVSRNLLGIQSATDGVSRSFGDRLNGAMRRNDQALARSRGGLIDAAAGFYALRAAIASPIRAAMEFESAMADVKKVVDFETPEEFEQFRDDIIAMSRELPLTVAQLTELAAIGGSAGLSGDQLRQFVEQAAKLGVAFDITAEQAGDFQNSMRAALGMDLTEILSLGDAINHVSNSMAATAPDLTNFLTRVAGDLDSFGFAAEDAVAFGAAMIASGHGADVAATSFRAMGRNLALGESNSNRTKEALQSLGLEAANVAERMQEDAVGTILDVFERINAAPAEMQAALRSDIFGNEARALPGIISNLDLLREALGYVQDESEFAGSAFREFEARAATFENSVIQFKNRINALQVVIGAALIPALNDLMDVIAPVIDRITEFAQANPELVKNVLAAASAVIGLKIAIAGLKFVGLLGRGGALAMLSIGLNTVGRASMGLYAAAAANVAYTRSLAGMAGINIGRFTAIGAALRGIAGVTGLSAIAGALSALAVPVAIVAGLGFTLWKWWDRISSAFAGAARAIMEQLAPAIDWIKEKLEFLQPVADGISATFSGLKDVFSGLFDFLGNLFQREILTEEEKAAAEQRAYDYANSIIERIKFAFNEFIDWVTGWPQRIIEAIGNIDLSDIITWPSVDGFLEKLRGVRSAIQNIGNLDIESSASQGPGGPSLSGRATGGPVQRGTPYIVGEEGPELVTFGHNGFVHDARTTLDMLNTAPSVPSAASAPADVAASAVPAGQPQINIAGPLVGQINMAEGQNPMDMVEEIGQALEDEMARRMRGFYGTV